MKMNFHNLPEPLTLEQEQGLVKKIQSEEGDLEARNELVTRNLRFVLKIVGGFRGQLDYDDFEQLKSDAMYRTLKCAENFEDKGVKFTSYLASFMPQFIRTRAYQLKKGELPNESSRVRLNHGPEYHRSTGKTTHALEEGWKGISWEEMISSKGLNPEEEYEIKEDYKLLEKKLNQLDERGRKSLVAYFYDEKSLDFIGYLLGGVSREWARQIKDGALEDMRNLYNKKLYYKPSEADLEKVDNRRKRTKSGFRRKRRKSGLYLERLKLIGALNRYKNRKQKKEKNKEATNAIRRAYDSGIGISQQDICYFLGTSQSTITTLVRKNNIRRPEYVNKPAFPFLRVASQVYALKDEFGASDDEISTMVIQDSRDIDDIQRQIRYEKRVREGKIPPLKRDHYHPRISPYDVSYILKIRNRIEPELIQILRSMFPDQNIDKAYR